MNKNFNRLAFCIAVLWCGAAFGAVVRTTSEGGAVTGQTSDNTLSSALTTGTPAFATGDILTLDADAKLGSASGELGAFTLSVQSNDGTVRTVTRDTSARFFTSENATLNLTNITLDGTGSPFWGQGSGIYAAFRNSLTMVGYNASIKNCSGGEGAAIFAGNGLTFNGSCTFESNQSLNQSGGAISAAGGKFTSTGTLVFTNNTAHYAGGAVYARDGVTLSGSHTFTGNKSTGDYSGGAIKTNGLTISGTSVFTNNSAVNGSGRSGGAIRSCMDDGTGGFVTFSGADSSSVFSGNTFNGNPNDIFTGGAVTFQDAGTYRLEGGIVANSLTIQDGAAVTFGSNAVNRLQNANSSASTLLSGSVTGASTVTFEGTQSFGSLTLTDSTLALGTSANAGNLTLSTLDAANSTLAFTLFDTLKYDTLKVTDTNPLNLTDLTFLINFSDLFAAETGDTFDILTAAGGIQGLDAAVFQFDGPDSFVLSLTNGGTTLQLTYLPEPAAWGLLLLGIPWLFRFRKGRK